MSDVQVETREEKPRTIKLEQLGLRFAKESFDEVIEDIKPLLVRHWEELAAYPDIPLDPDYGFYQRADAGGFIRIYTGRLDGELIAYAIMTIIKRHPHYQGQAFANSDIVLVIPEHRNAKVATGLFDLIERDLAGYVVSISTKNSHPELQMLARVRGYEAISTDFCKRL